MNRYWRGGKHLVAGLGQLLERRGRRPAVEAGVRTIPARSSAGLLTGEVSLVSALDELPSGGVSTTQAASSPALIKCGFEEHILHFNYQD